MISRFKPLLMLCCLIPCFGQAQTELSTEQQAIINDALREMLIDISNDPAFSGVDWLSTDALIMRRPETHRQLGAILNVNYSAKVSSEGLEVLAVTPGLMAEQMGLQPMDRILHINQINLLNRGADDNMRSEAYREFVREFSRLEDGEVLELEIRRNGAMQTLRGNVALQSLPRVEFKLISDTTDLQPIEPAARTFPPSREPEPGCGSINSRQATPHAEDIFPVVITGVNTSANELRQRDVVYLTPGTYQVRLLDFIPHYELRSKHTRFARSRPSKELTVTVEDGKVYYLGARLLYSIRDQADQDEYWEPVVWKTDALDCLGTPITPES